MIDPFIPPIDRERFRSEQIRFGVLPSEKPFEDNLERFFAKIRFDGREKLKDIPNFQSKSKEISWK
jgi:hypothetical protein